MRKNLTFSDPSPLDVIGASSSAARKTVIYVGGFGLPDRTASAQRCLGNAKLLRSVGFEVVIVGKLSAERPAREADTRRVIDGFQCYDIRAPLPGRKYRSYVYFADPIEAVIGAIGSSRVHAVMAYNYPALGLWRLMDSCDKLGIRTVVECTEWYGWEGKALFTNSMRIVGSFWRARVLAPRAGNVVVASRYLLKYYRDKNVLVLPFVVDVSESKWFSSPPKEAKSVRRLVYAGSPGLGLRKDKINYLIESLGALKEEGIRFHLDVVGMTQAEYLQSVPEHRRLLESALGDSVRFHGRVPHQTAIELQKAADFSVFFRDPDRVSSVGFPTKYVEAVACGIPSITNPTSDLPEYLTDGVNGFLARSHRRDDIADALRRALQLSDGELSAMKDRVTDNPFHYVQWKERASRFLNAIH